MEKSKRMNKCSECEHFGDGRFPVVNYFVNGELRAEFVGYSDRPNGKAVEHFSHKCDVNTKLIVYDNSDACKDFTPKTWERPSTCRECTCYKRYYNDGSFLCERYPFNAPHRNDDKSCPNGKSECIKQYKIFEFIK